MFPGVQWALECTWDAEGQVNGLVLCAEAVTMPFIPPHFGCLVMPENKLISLGAVVCVQKLKESVCLAQQSRIYRYCY